MSFVLSACLETLFKDTEDISQRIPLAVEAGCNAVEMWFAKGKDVLSITSMLQKENVSLRLMLAEPVLPITDAAQEKPYLKAMSDNLISAKRFGCDTLIVQSGPITSGLTRKQQGINIRNTLGKATDMAKAVGITLLYEPLNSKIDHKGYFADDTAEAVRVVQDINSPALRMLFDIYHSSVMEEDLLSLIESNLDLIAHFHIADTLGRHEPGTGTIDYATILSLLKYLDYKGTFGLEYFPQKPSAVTISDVLRLFNDTGWGFDELPL